MAITRINSLVSTHRLFIGDLLTPIIVQLWRNDETGYLSASADHDIHTPVQASPYFPEPGDYHQTPESALKWIVDGYESYYDQAVDEGHTPAESWLPSV